MGPSVKFIDNLILRVENESCAKSVLELYQRNKINFEQFEPTRPNDFYTLEYHKRMLHREYMAYLSNKFIRYFIYSDKNPSRIIGAINYNIMNNGKNDYAELGYKVDIMYQQQGIAYKACLSTFDILANEYGIDRIDARIHPHNIASIRLAEKIGFKPICLEPKSANILGHYVDLIRYSVNISEIQ
ncbi:MAG: GNAT family N-acetyltransferase [Lachnospiraceae bacterium]|nr:GNAT family N-acetyltransferase [Lachnospiraceae bacterium]